MRPAGHVEDLPKVGSSYTLLQQTVVETRSIGSLLQHVRRYRPSKLLWVQVFGMLTSLKKYVKIAKILIQTAEDMQIRGMIYTPKSLIAVGGFGGRNGLNVPSSK